MTEPRLLLEAKGIVKSYPLPKGELEVLKGVNLEVASGEMMYIFGHSGSGKSTLLHILGGLDQPKTGSVELGGAELYKLSESRLARLRNEHIGFVFQFFHLLPELSLLENVALPALIGGRHAEARARELLAAVRLTDRAEHFPSELSGGEQQRAAIARALINDPEIVFCDEPTGNLDDESTAAVMGLIEKMNRETGKAFCIVTHEADLIQDHKRVFQLQNGVLTRRA